VQIGAVEPTQGGHGLAHSGTTLGWGDDRQPQLDFDAGSAGADAHFEAAFCEY
jgi:hypothetical protein